MANRTWVGTDTAGDWGVAANWAEVAVPINADDVFISSGSQDVTGSLDQSAVTLDSLRIGPEYTGSGTDGFKINATDFDFSSGGTAWYTEGNFTTVRVSGGVSSANMFRLKGTTTNLRVLGGLGTVTVEDGADLTNFECIQAPTVDVDIGANVTSLASVIVDSGDVTLESSCTAVTCRGGTLTIEGTAAIGTLTLEPGGTVVYNSSGTITTFTGEGGFFDGRQNPSVSVTITNSTLHEGCTMNLQSGLRNFTLGNPLVSKGGILIPDMGQTLTIA